MWMRWLVGCGVVVWLSGCGARVVVDKEGAAEGGGGTAGAGGDGGAGAAGGSGGTTVTTDTTTIPPGDVTQACLDYCAAATPANDCYGLEGCQQRCMGLYVPGCTEQVEALLSCLPDWLFTACQIGYPDDFNDGCSIPMNDLQSCGQSAYGNCPDWGDWLIDQTACYGYANCASAQFEVQCEGDASCVCLKDGIGLGECEMPFSGAEACTPAFTCCRAFYGL